MRKTQQKIARLHERIHDTRKNFHYQIAHHLCDGVGMVFAEDLNLKAMSRGMLCKHNASLLMSGNPPTQLAPLDAGFGGFLEILAHVCWKRGVYFAKVNADGTSQTCPNCDTYTGKKQLSQRVHECPYCQFKTDRDVAAAMVVEQRGLAAVGLTVKLPVDVSSAGDSNILVGTVEAGKPSRKSRKPTLSSGFGG